MEKFAVVSLPDGGDRIIKGHPILRHLPHRYASKCLKYIPVQVSAVIMDKEYESELGYMLDVPGFFMDWDKLSKEERCKNIDGIIKRVHDLDVSCLSFPLIYDYLDEDEIIYLQHQGFKLLDGFRIRLSSLLMATQTILSIVKKDLPFYEVGIWGADSEIGRVWVESLAGQVNHMCVGGSDSRVMEFLSDKVMKSTGLSCQITDDPEVCIKDKHIAVLAEGNGSIISNRQPSFNIFTSRKIIEDKSLRNCAGRFCINSGWLGFPQDLSVDYQLLPWDELGVLEGLFYIISKVYRNDILLNRITLKQMHRIQALFGLYPLKVLGYLDEDRRITFDRLRMDYYRNRRKKLFELNIIP